MGEPAQKATMEEVWAAIKATEEVRLRGEEARLRGEEALRKSQLKTEESQQKTEESLQKTQKEVRELNQSLKEQGGNFNNKWGQFLENFLEGDLVSLLDGRGIKVERTFPRFTIKISGRVVAEYDFLAINGKEIVLVEVKTTLEKDHVGLFLEKLKKFKKHLPEHKDKTLYGTIAYMSIKEEEKDRSKTFPEYKDASEMAQDKGLFLIQAPGGAKDVSKIVNNKNFKPKSF